MDNEVLNPHKRKILEDKKQQQDLREKEKERVKKVFAEALKSYSAKEVFRYIFKYCDPFTPKVSKGGTGELLALNLAYLKGIENVYLELRKYIPEDQLLDIERRGD